MRGLFVLQSRCQDRAQIEPKEPMQKWRVRGLVAGPALPNGGIKLGSSCRISRITDQESQRLASKARQRLADFEGLMAAQFGYPDVFSVEMPITASVFSKHELSIVVEATDENDAFTKAPIEVDRCLGALALAVGTQRYRFYPSLAKRLPGPSGLDKREYAHSGLGSVTEYEKQRLRKNSLSYAQALLGMDEKDEVFEKAFGFLRAAWRLKDIPLGDPVVQRAILSNCFLVLETISNSVTREWKRHNKENTLAEQGLAVDALQESLERVESVSKRVAAVREAHTQLQRAERHFQDLKLETAGQKLGVEGRFIDLARELNRLRNRHLGHAGSTSSEELEEWIYKSNDPRLLDDTGHFGKGELTAMAYLKAYSSGRES
jgi:hypothetical protein